jgi:hypothetical protein
MCHEFTETKEECALKELMIRVGVTANTLRDMQLLGRAIEYANLEYYTRPGEIRHRQEQVQNDIFFIRAASYYKRKNLNPLVFENRILMQRILEHEHNEVRFQKMKLL